MANPVFDLANEHINAGGIVEIYVPENSADQRYISGFTGPISSGGGIWQPIVTDPDVGQTITYSIVPYDGNNISENSNMFNIDPVTGVLTFKDPHDFENPQGILLSGPGGLAPSNVYRVTIQADDGHGGVTQQAVNFGILNQNEAPTITNAPAAITVDDPITPADVIIDLNATDPDAGTNLTWSIPQVFNVGNQHGFLFNINPTTGELTFNGNLDVFGDQVFLVRVQVDDGAGGTSSSEIAVTLHDTFVNTPPVIIGGEDPGPVVINAAENQTTVTTVQTLDPDPQILQAVYTIVGGADADKFSISSAAGQGFLTFTNAPDYENPTDANGDGFYDVNVLATDWAGGTDSQAYRIAVTNDPADDNRPPVITADGGGTDSNYAIPENTTLVTPLDVVDPDAGQTLTYSIVGGADATLFNLNKDGILSFNNAPNYENPTDVGGDNQYDVTVQVDDGNGGIDTQAVHARVQDAFENAPPTITTINLGGGGTQIDSVGYTDGQTNWISDPFATDPDAGQTLTWSIAGGPDGDKFYITTDGAGHATLNWVTPPDFDPQREVVNDGFGRQINPYHVDVQVDDGNGGTDVQSITVSLYQNPWFPGVLVDSAPTAVSVDENTTTVTTVHADDNLGPYSFSIDPNVGDASKFQIDQSGHVSFITAPDFEHPTDVGQDGVYNVSVIATDNSGRGPESHSSQALSVTVQDVNENSSPTLQNGTVPLPDHGLDSSNYQVDENITAVAIVQATDPDAGQTLTYSVISDPASFPNEDQFTINPTTGELSFITPPDFENGTGSGPLQNHYTVGVQVDDGNGGTDQQVVNIVVNDVNENSPPVFDLSGVSSRFDGLHTVADIFVSENATLAYQPIVTDPDAGQTITYSIVPGQYDGLNKFTIDPQTGAVSFLTPPDFENPTDEDHDGFYNVVIQADDGNGGVTQLAIHAGVTNVAENSPPVFDYPDGILLLTTEGVISARDVNATDPNGDAITYSIVPSDQSPTSRDAGEFTIDPVTGQLSFVTPPDYEHPTGSRGVGAPFGNNYEVLVKADDGHGGVTYQQNYTEVGNNPADDNAVPVFAAFAALGPVLENTTAVGTAHATDADPGQTVTYSISPIAGDGDSYVGQPNLFQVDPATGVLSFINAPDFENPQDTGGIVDNIYDVWVKADDGNGGIAYQKITTAVTDESNAPQNFAGTNGVDTYTGGEGNDTINGSKGNDILSGHNGIDTINGGDGNDTIHGGNGNDILSGGNDDDIVWGDAGNDSIDGGNGNDSLIGGFGNDTINGNQGKDIIAAGPGSNIVDGGNDTDYMIFSGSKADYTFAFATQGKINITGPDGGITSVKAVEVFHFEDGTNYTPTATALVETNDATINPYLASHGVTHDWLVS